MCVTVSDTFCGVSSEHVGHSGKAHGGQEDDSPAHGRLSGQGEVETIIQPLSQTLHQLLSLLCRETDLEDYIL